MKKILSVIILFFVSLAASAQVEKGDEYLQEPDSLAMTIQLEEVSINGKEQKVDAEFKKQFLILQRRVYKVYPYAKTAATRLTALDAGMAKMKTKKEKRKYQKIVEQYVKDEFEPQLKKMSRKDGQILVKLIYRQTGHTTFDLIKDYKSGWKAFWSQNTAKLFDINLKTKYDPMAVNQDYLIETILTRAFANKRLVQQEPAFQIDFLAVTDHWEELLSKPQPEPKKK